MSSMELAETGTATTSGLAKTLRHFGLDTRTPGLQREDRRAELQKRLGDFERARRVPPPPAKLLARKAGPAGNKVPPPPPGASSKKNGAMGRPALVPPPPKEHTAVKLERNSSGHDEPQGPRRAPKLLPESKLPPENSFDCDVCGLHFKKVAHLIVHSRSHKRDSAPTTITTAPRAREGPRGPAGRIDYAEYSSDEEDDDDENDDGDDDDDGFFGGTSEANMDDAGDVRGLVEGLSLLSNNNHAGASGEGKERETYESKQDETSEADRDEAWIEGFARDLVRIARQAGGDTRQDSPPRREEKTTAETRPKPPAILQKMRTAPARALVPPPRGAPPAHLARTASAHAVLVSPKRSREPLARGAEAAAAGPASAEAEALRREIEALDRKRAARIRARLHDSKDVEIQEAEWDLQRAQQELRRVERHKGIFIDSRLASANGHMQRWAKEDLLPKLESLEREASARLEQEIARIRAEEESHPQYGRQAQNERRFKLHQMMSGSNARKGRQGRSEGSEGAAGGGARHADADEIGKEALSLHMSKRDLARAEVLYRRAVALDGRHATNLGNLALFIQQFGTSQRPQDAHGGDPREASDCNHRDRAHDDGDEAYRAACDAQADKYYRQAISADPSHSTNLANYASFLHKNLRQYERAEQYFERAVHEAPANASILGNYAVFLFRVRKDLVRADRTFRRALEIDPRHVNNCCNFATLLKKGFNKHREAKALYEDALKISPDNATVLCNYANMLVKGADPADDSPEGRAMVQKARDLYLHALRVNPAHRMAKRNYMIFLRDFPTVRNLANERKLSPGAPPVGRRPQGLRVDRSASPPTSPVSPKSRRRSKRSRSPPAMRRPMSPTLETLIE